MTTTPTIVIVNQSTVVTDADAAKIAVACNAQIATQVAPIWGRLAWPVVFRAGAKPSLAPGEYPVYILDNSDQPGALGYHTEDSSGIYGRVFAETVIQNGGTILNGVNSIAVTTSHEVMELYGDPAANKFAQDTDSSLYAVELCDAVENDAGNSIDGISVSNFVIPAFFDPARLSVKRDWLGKLNKAFSMSTNGYQVKIDPTGNISQVFGRDYPKWKKAVVREEHSRSEKRIAKSGRRRAE